MKEEVGDQSASAIGFLYLKELCIFLYIFNQIALGAYSPGYSHGYSIFLYIFNQIALVAFSVNR